MPATEKIQFVDTNADTVLNRLVAFYENLTGKKLQPAQIERLVFNAVAYRISLLLNAINEAANQSLIAFATGPGLEALAELVGVTRLPASAAQCTIRFQLVSGHGALVVDKGIRIQSIDGLVVFTTMQDTIASDLDDFIDVKCECTKTGVVGNGYIVDKINILLDPRPYVTSVSNIDVTAGGNDDETDEELRDRVRLAPSQFSVAGPTGAYKFWAKSAHPSIVDVAVTIGHNVTTGDVIPGQVDIFPLIYNNGALTTEIQDAIYAICNDEKIRPLTDTVVVKEPVKTDYAISVNLTILTDAISADVTTAVTKALQAYVDERKNKLGIDVVRTQLIGACQLSGVYSVDIASPLADIVVGENGFTNNTAILVTVTGTHDH